MRPGVNLATPLPEGAADVLFSCAGRSYQLKLNNCVKLPGHGWVLGADIELIDLAAQAEAEKAWTEDFPAAQLRATEQKKRLLVNFTGSDWDPLCIALNKNVLTQPEFLQHANENFVLVKVDFPRNKPQADPQREANQILERAYRVLGFPTVLVLEANGTEVKRLNGYSGATPEDFIKSLTPPKPTPPPPRSNETTTTHLPDRHTGPDRLPTTTKRIPERCRSPLARSSRQATLGRQSRGRQGSGRQEQQACVRGFHRQ